MKKMTDETRERVRYALQHPITWAKGADLPEETIRPWEHIIQFSALTLVRFAQGFSEKRWMLYEGKGEGKIPSNWFTIPGIINSAWDIANDPVIGSYMDRHQFGTNAYRWIMRTYKSWTNIWKVLLMFNFGLKPLHRLILWSIVGFVEDIFGTANTVADAKIWAGITPSSVQRSKVQLAKTLGNQTGMALAALSLLFMGLKDVFGVTDYQILCMGALVMGPLSLFGDLLPSFAKQRVTFEQKDKEEVPSLRESFAIVRHNKWFIIKAICGFITVFTPQVQGELLWRFFVPMLHYRGRDGKVKEITGEAFWLIAMSAEGTPGTLLQPFARQVIKRVGGERNTLMINDGATIFKNLLYLLIGYKSLPRVALLTLAGMPRETTNKWAPVAEGVIEYEMLDYVEWKTGHRSEGVTMSVNALINKLITSNIGNATRNAYMSWTGYQGWDEPRESQPKRFYDTFFPMMCLTATFDAIVWLIGRSFYRYPKELRDQVEADLIERRRLAERKQLTVDS